MSPIPCMTLNRTIINPSPLFSVQPSNNATVCYKNYRITDGPANTTQSNNIKERLKVIHYLIPLNVCTIATHVTISSSYNLRIFFNISTLSA